jgi:hypothetical protein
VCVLCVCVLCVCVCVVCEQHRDFKSGLRLDKSKKGPQMAKAWPERRMQHVAQVLHPVFKKTSSVQSLQDTNATGTNRCTMRVCV